MNKIKKIWLAGLLALGASHQAMAALVLDGTRFIYNEGDKSISVRVMNRDNALFGGQVWIDNTNQAKDAVFMVPSPPFFRVDGKQQQVVRIMNVNNALPQDKESLFYLNVLGLPPKPDKNAGNVLALAMNTKVKLIYRPSLLEKGRKGAESKIEITRKGKDAYLVNPTPYYFAVTSITMNNKNVPLTTEQSQAIGAFKPFSQVQINALPATKGKVTLNAINDWGGVQTHSF